MANSDDRLGAAVTSDSYSRWCVDPNQLEQLDEKKARDLVVDCFLDAQRETFVRMKENIGVTPDDAGLRRSVKGAVRLAFAKTGGDFDSPTCESLQDAIGELAAKAAAWGTPDDIIAHHKEQIGLILSRLC